MYYDAPESAHQALSVLLYMALLSVWERVISWETQWREVYRNLVDAVVSDCARFIVAICALPLVLHCFFGSLVGVLAIVKYGVNTEYVLMEFTIL